MKRTTKEPKLSPASALAPIVAQLQAMIAGMASAPLTADDLDAKAFTDGRRDGLQSAITLLVRASATTITNDDGQKLVKLERPAPARDEIGLLDKRIDQLARRVFLLEQQAGTPKPTKAMPEILKAPSGEKKLGRCERALLAVLAERPTQATSVAQLSILSGYSLSSSSFTNALGTLRSRRLANGPRDDIRITSEGVTEAGHVPRAPRSGQELLAYWCAKLKKAERTILAALVEYGAHERAELAEATGYSQTSSSFTNAIGQLRTLKLVQPGWPARAADAFSKGGT
jgi:hypothetical protein